MKKKLLSIPILLALAILSTAAAQAQQLPGKGPGPYAPNGAGNPYAQQLNELAAKDPVKHDGCYTQANEKNLRHEPRWKFMLECMKK
jgi:hypothetical protein|uniref:hypothetical protein n=1 Tax=Polynucleobacter sp. TaxID=2029855 RepID=UPI0040482E06